MSPSDFAKAAKKVERKLFAHALTFTKDEDDAKDLLQETMVKGIRFCDSFDEHTNIASWLYVIMRNTFINSYLKAVKKRELITTDEEISSAQLLPSASVNAGPSSFALGDIRQAMEALSPVYRTPFQRYFEGYKYEEIAIELDIPLGTVKTRIHQAREQLKKYLKIYRS